MAKSPVVPGKQNMESQLLTSTFYLPKINCKIKSFASIMDSFALQLFTFLILSSLSNFSLQTSVFSNHIRQFWFSNRKSSRWSYLTLSSFVSHFLSDWLSILSILVFISATQLRKTETNHVKMPPTKSSPSHKGLLPHPSIKVCLNMFLSENKQAMPRVPRHRCSWTSWWV